MKPLKSVWDADGLDADLRRLWGKGASCVDIAAYINDKHGTAFTRNAVIGRVHRLKLPCRHRPPGTVGKIKPQKPRRLSPPNPTVIAMPVIELPPVPVVDQDIPLEQRKSLMELKDGDCRWPCGTPGEPGFFFCAAPVASGNPYCAGHCARAYVPAYRSSRPFVWMRFPPVDNAPR